MITDDIGYYICLCSNNNMDCDAVTSSSEKRRACFGRIDWLVSNQAFCFQASYTKYLTDHTHIKDHFNSGYYVW